ncbi:MAG: glycosyltransferase family 1 protein [Saprospiraceae bacterium]|nr:glycosyltransferase family 1 protein [Saprospiraceae bacterium]
MKIGFDAKRYFNNRTGLGNYSRTLVSNLLKFHAKDQYVLYSPSIELTEEKTKLQSYDNVKIQTAGSKNHAIWRSFEIKKDINRDQLDIYHGLSHELPRSNENLQCKKIVTIHDLIFKKHPEFFPYIDRSFYHIKCKHSLNTADKIIAISENTRNDIIEYFNINPSKIEVIYQACQNTYYLPDKSSTVPLPKSFPSTYNLSVGSLEPRKNINAVIKAYSQISEKDRIPLFLIGNGKRHKKLLQKNINHFKLQKSIHILSNISSELLPTLYENAQMLIYPSLYEGFGLPVAEALLCSTPVITSNNSSLLEAGGPDSRYIDPYDAESIAHAIIDIQSNTELSTSMKTKGLQYATEKFGPKKLTDQLMNLYKDVK